MISKKLTGLLGALKADEIKRLGDFLRSPYHNKQQFVIRLFEELMPYYPQFPAAMPGKEEIFRKLYPSKSYSDSRMRNLLSDLLGLTEKFLSIEKLEYDKVSKQVYLLEALPVRGLERMFELRFDKFRKDAFTAAPADETGYLDRLKLLNAQSIFVNRLKPNEPKINFECYQSIMNESIKFFLAGLMKNYSIILNKNITFFKYEFDTRFIDLVIWYMETVMDDYKADTCIMLYYYTCIFYREYDEASLKKLEEFTFSNFSKLSPIDAMNALTNMVNYCRRQALAGSKEYEARALNLFKLAIRENLWNVHNKIRPSIFRGIVSIAGNCGDHDWAEEFIEKFRTLQPAGHIEPNTLLAKGRLLFDRKKYDDALSCLSHVKPPDATYKYETDTLVIRIFYEQIEIESYIDKVKAFKKWVKNNNTKISQRYRLIFTEMAGYFERLIHLKLDPDEYRLSRMKQEINDNKTLVNRLWFLEKLEEIEIKSK